MDRLQELINLYPDTTIVQPSCGAKTVYFVLDLFGKDPVDLSLLENAINSDQATKESSLLDIQAHLEANNLYTLPVHTSLSQIDGVFDSYVSIIHTISKDQNIQQETPNHFVALVKSGSSYFLADLPELEKYELSTNKSIKEFESDIGYAKTMLLVSDQPIHIHSNNMFLLWGILLVIIVAFFTILKTKRKRCS